MAVQLTETEWLKYWDLWVLQAPF